MSERKKTHSQNFENFIMGNLESLESLLMFYYIKFCVLNKYFSNFDGVCVWCVRFLVSNCIHIENFDFPFYNCGRLISMIFSILTVN